jgi:methylenetetrahydrofolate dehydrogenase (NADP+)/methenyltetrahydrofolate cyclohydrolase
MRIDVKSWVQERKKRLKELGLKKTLLIIQVGNIAASNAYIRGKIKDCEEVGFNVMHWRYEAGVDAERIATDIRTERHYFDGIILQEPAEVGGDKEHIISAINARQDVDGFRQDSWHKPCTPLGIMELLKYVRGGKTLRGSVVTIVGRGKLVGRPLIDMMADAGATVIACNSATPNLKDMTSMADIVIMATGARGLLQPPYVKKGAIVIDAGINVDEDGKLHGDADKSLYDDPDVLITTVPGGVGLVTRLMLLENLSRS